MSDPNAFHANDESPMFTHSTLHPSSNLEPGRLYALLTYRGDLASWNWAFFVPDPAQSPIGSGGTVFHVKSDVNNANRWVFETASKDIVGSPLTVAIVRLGDLESLGAYHEVVGMDGLLSMFKTVEIPKVDDGRVINRHGAEFSSRTWFLDAIRILHDCGVITCNDVWLLERELRRCAFAAMDGYLQSKGWSVYHAERCS
ncbi:hypothetical protein BDN71DRAFT_1440867 [Pleurotus eryngii]|uniref:Uncharacterized protein n=1 Tax=Pleurotus eryngii TaxID=5323 RepID=A0A9P6A6Q3_PLEER|nr:hypothetical protein BDN71DRAFT_1440867 [Pleurotus eryngii]